LEQRSGTAAFLIKSVRCDSGRYALGRNRAHGNYLNGRKSAPHHGKKFEAGHSRHIEVRNNKVGNFLPEQRQGGESIRRRAHAIPK
jgi:hypothetical protein